MMTTKPKILDVSYLPLRTTTYGRLLYEAYKPNVTDIVIRPERKVAVIFYLR